MADWTMKRNDTAVPLYRSLTHATGALAATNIPLAAASRVRMFMSQSAILNTASCVIASAAGGVVRHDWVAVETASSGIFNCEYEILWNDGTIQTVPNSGYFSIEIVADLG